MINNFFKRNKKILTLTVFGVFLYFIFGDLSFAEDTEDFLKDDGYHISEDGGKKLTKRMSALSTFLSLGLAFMTHLSTLFLSSDWYSGGLFGLNGIFKNIWIFVSNIVYFIFAFILIFIAFMNIIGRGGEKYELKKALPKLAVGILIVPFSWFFVNFILSVVSILSIAGLNLPSNSFGDYKTAMDNIEIPKSCVIDYAAGLDGLLDCTGTGTLESSSSSSSTLIYKTISIYTYKIIGLQDIPKVLSTTCDNDAKNENNSGNCIETIGELIVKLLFDVLFLVLYVVLIIALGLVLMIRGIYLWLYMMLSPLFGLMYFFDKSGGGGEFFDKFNIKQFFSLAMVPVYTMLALSFGLLFIYIIGSGIINDKTDGNNGEFVFSDNKISISGVELEIKGPMFNNNTINNFITSSKEAGGGGLDVVGGMILRIMGIVFLWMAVMAALRSSEVTRAIVEPLHAFGGQVGGMLKTAPQMIPIFPGGQSMKSMGSAASSFKTGIEGYHSQKGADLGSRYSDLLVGANKEIRDIESAFRGVSADNPKQMKDAIETALPKLDKHNSMSIEKFINGLKSIKFDENLKVDDIRGKNDQEIANLLIDKQNPKLQSVGFQSFGDYVKLLGVEISQSIGDNTSSTMTKTEFDEFLKSDNNNLRGDNDDIKINNQPDGSYGQGTIYSRNINKETGATIIDVNFQNITKDGKKFVGTDLEEAIDLYKKLGNNEGKLRESLTLLDFNNVDDLVKHIIDSYNSNN